MNNQYEIGTAILAGIIIFVLCFIGFLMLYFSIYEYDIKDKKPSASEFCVRNGYLGAFHNNYDNGYCYYPRQSYFDVKPNQYFAWDGTNWRFIK